MKQSTQVFVNYAASSKDAFLKEGVLDTVVNALNVSSDANVLMKAIGCLRLLCKTEGMIHALIYYQTKFKNSLKIQL